MVKEGEKKQFSLEVALKWVRRQVDTKKIVAISRKLTTVPCPFAYGIIKCNINPKCVGRVVRKNNSPDGVQYFCYYEDIPVVSEEVINQVTTGLIAMYITEIDIIDRMAKIIYLLETDREKAEFETFLFSSSYLGQLIISKDTCISCLYRNEVKRQKEKDSQGK